MKLWTLDAPTENLDVESAIVDLKFCDCCDQKRTRFL